MTFVERLDGIVERSGSLLCVGLDPQDAADAAAAERVCAEIVDATLASACAYKANIAFFEQFGSRGYAALERLRNRIPAERVYIVDAKRGDIPNTSRAYARALFDVLGADAVTVNPLLGQDAVAPFLDREDCGIFILARTSNQGAADLLDELLASGLRLHERIVELGGRWDPGGRIGFVVGATDPESVAATRRAAPSAPLLLPGVGAQGADLEEAVRAGLDERGRGLLVNVSRAVATAPEGPARAAAELRTRIDAAREAVARP